jgi:hypothetical protein
VLVAVQIMLGAFVIWSAMQPIINTIHVVNGALVLGTSLVLTLRGFRSRLQTAELRVAANEVPHLAQAAAKGSHA